MNELLGTLLPEMPGISLDSVDVDACFLHLKVSLTNPVACCPLCKQPSQKVHSTYPRTLADLPWAGRVARMVLTVRKFFCLNETCCRRIFTERLCACAGSYQRRTLRQQESLTRLFFTAGGRPGTLLACKLDIPASASTLLRLGHAVEIPANACPRVVGIDDWAFRKGHRYGTILVDLEKREPVDLLPDREVDTVKKWLEEHPGIEIISRDRGTNYMKAAREGAPAATQVADRWHLLKNLGEALQRLMNNHNRELRQVAVELSPKKDQMEVAEAQNNPKAEGTEEGLPDENAKKASRYAVNFEAVHRLWKEGHSNRAICRMTGVHRQTIKRYLAFDTYPEKCPTPAKRSSLLPFYAFIHEKWAQGNQNVVQLWRDLKEQGYSGSAMSVYRFTKNFPRQLDTSPKPMPLKIPVWTALQSAICLSKPSEKWNEYEKNYLEALFITCPHLKNAHELALKFRRLLKDKNPEGFDSWLSEARESGLDALKQFATGLKEDYAAVKAAMSLIWSNGQVEGQVNRLKTIKRQMYGRAGFELLRRRILFRSG